VLGENLDPDEFLKKYGTDKFKEKIDTAITATEYRLNHLMQGYNLNNDQEKIEFLSKAVVIIGKLANAFEKNLYIDNLSSQLNVSRELIAQEVYKDNYNANIQYGFRGKVVTQEPITKLTNDKKAYLEKQLITYFVNRYDELSEIQKKLISSFRFTEDLQNIVDTIITYFERNEQFSLQNIIENADIDVSTGLIDLMNNQLESFEHYDIELILNNLIALTLDEEINALKSRLKESEDPTSIQQLIQQKIIEKQAITLKIRNHKLKN
jgi:DNA primase